MRRSFLVLSWLASLAYVADMAWKEGRGKTWDESTALHAAQNDTRAARELADWQLRNLKAADDSLILDYQNALDEAQHALDTIKCN
jgi:hypothetical protein